MQNFSQSKNKFGYIYLITPQGVAEKAMLTVSFMRRKLQVYEAIRVEIDALSAEAGPDGSKDIKEDTL
jgi:hypothetical protein